MKDPKLNQFARQLENLGLMEAAEVTDDPWLLDSWDWGNSPLGNGKHAARFQENLRNMLLPRVLAKQMTPGDRVVVPETNPSDSVFIGHSTASGKSVRLSLTILNRHLMVVGSSGSGKTTLLARIVSEILTRTHILVTFHDHKGEGRRFLNRLPRRVIVFKPGQEFCNMIEPEGSPETFWTGWASEFAKCFSLLPQTWTELPAIMMRLLEGMRPGDPYPSLKDFERVLRHLADEESRPKLETAAQSLTSLNYLLKNTARIRRGPAWKNRYRLVVYEHLGLPPRIHGFICAARLLRAQMRAVTNGKRESGLTQLWVSDEGTKEFGKELSQSAGSGYISPSKTAITQMRSAGVGILVGVQLLSEIDDSLRSNVATIVVLRCPDPKEAREAAQMLGLPQEAATEIQNLPVGFGYVRSEGFGAAVKITIPPFDLGPYLSDDELAARLSSEWDNLERETVYSPPEVSRSEPLSYRDILDDAEPEKPSAVSESGKQVKERFLAEHRELLQEIEQHAEASVREHYHHLGWSGSRGTRIKEELLDMGLIRTDDIQFTGGRPRTILTLTEKGKRLLSENT